MSPKHLWSACTLSALLFGLASSSGCVPTDSQSQDDDGGSTTIAQAIEDNCQLVASCEGGNAADRSACIIGTEVNQSFAGVTGCTSLFEAFITCAQDNNLCSESQLTFQCNAEQAALDACTGTVTEPVGDEPAASSAAQAWCADNTACGNLSELERWTCQIQFDGYLDTARAYGCSSEAASFAACAPVDNSCVDGSVVLGGECDVALSAMIACNTAASSL